MAKALIGIFRAFRVKTSIHDKSVNYSYRI